MKIHQINKLKVTLDFGNESIDVGELVNDKSNYFFKYFETFLASKLDISPFKIKKDNTIQKVDNQIFDGLFGIFDDSLPDGWGRLLLDRRLEEMGIGRSLINPLQRLALVGMNGPGALCYEPIIDSGNGSPAQIELDLIAQEVDKVLNDEPTEFLEDLFRLGGSSGGARPKINVGYNKASNQISFDISEKAGFEPWIIKFQSNYDPKDISKIEYAYSLMAKDAGLDMADCKLFEGKSGSVFFGTKRFDRNNGTRFHVHSVAGLLNDNFRMSSLDYGHVMDCAFQLENHVEAYDKILRLAAFNIFTHNLDDHSKNISFLMDSKGNWKLSPAFDLTFSNTPHGYHSLTIAGEGKSPTSDHLKKLAISFGVKNVERIIEQVKFAVSNWRIFAEEAMLSKKTSESIAKIFSELLKT